VLKVKHYIVNGNQPKKNQLEKNQLENAQQHANSQAGLIFTKMPKLNGKHYAYTKKGYAAYKKAKAAKKRKKKGGSFLTNFKKMYG